jgi:RNA polymerase sigma factor (sigma-70 family)
VAEDAEGIACEALVEAARTWDGIHPWRPWLSLQARHYLWRAVRSEVCHNPPEPASLDTPVAQEAHGDIVTLGDTLAAPEAAVAPEDRMVLRAALARLDSRSRLVVRLIYGDGRTQREVASVVGCSQMHVSRIARRAVAALREAM